MAKNRTTSQSDQKPLRFSGIHRRLSEGIGELIRLYYLVKNKKPFIQEMKNFLKAITGENFEHYTEIESLLRKVTYVDNLSGGDNFLGGPFLINFDDSQKVLFVKVMDMLQEAIMKRFVYHFYPVRWIYRSEAFMEEPKLVIHAIDSLNDIGGEPFKVNRPVQERLIYKQAIESLREQQRQMQEYSISARNREGVKESKKKVKIYSAPYRAYKVWPATSFGKNLLMTKSTADFSKTLPVPTRSLEDQKDVSEIPSITFDRWRNFLQIVRSLLVDYHIVFGDYGRIKACLQCQKLFFERRAGKKLFCSDACRSKFSTELIGKLRCRKNQNGWISYRIDLIKEEHSLVPKRVRKPQCEKCDLWHPEGGRLKGGKCQILRRKNREAFEMINKEMEEKIKKKKIKKKLQWL